MDKKELTYLYEDKQILVVRKPAGLPVQSAGLGVMDLESLIRNDLAARREMGKQEKRAGSTGKNEKPEYLGIVHRLDQPVEGVLVFAKTPAAAAHLSAQVQDGRMKKEYLALVCPDSRGRALLAGMKDGEEKLLEDLLIRDGRTNTSRVAKPGEKNGKKAQLYFSVEPAPPQPGESAGPVLLRIRLLTGRHHQIRVQLAHAGLPIAGDRKYRKADEKEQGMNAAVRNATERKFPALCAYRLSFFHPVTDELMSFQVNNSFDRPTEV